MLCSKSLRNGHVERIICFPPTKLFCLFFVFVSLFLNFLYGGMKVRKETTRIVSSPSRTQDLYFGKRRLNFSASRWLVEVSLEVVKPPYGPFMLLLFSLRNYVLLAVLC